MNKKCIEDIKGKGVHKDNVYQIEETVSPLYYYVYLPLSEEVRRYVTTINQQQLKEYFES